MGDIAYIFAPENCDFCKMEGLEVQAQFDGKTVHGPWAYMCNAHFGVMGIGLGTGRGQRLIVGERPKDQPSQDEGEGEQEFPPPFPPKEITSPELSDSQEPSEKEKPQPPKTDWGNLYP